MYLRLSRDSAESTSIARQRETCLAVAQGRWPGAEVDVFEDVDISGYRDVQRPGFDQLVASIDGYVALVVYRIDRLTRRGARHLLEIVEDVLEPAGCALVSATEPLDTSGAFGELFITLLAALAKMESQRIGERQTAAQAHLRSVGRWTGGPAPFGYRTVSADSGAGKILELHEPEAEIVREVARQVVAGVKLTEAMPDDGEITTRIGWKSLLTNPVMAGYLTHNGELVYDTDGQPAQPWPAILDPALFRQVQAALVGKQVHRSSTKSLLGGIITCGRCGSVMYGTRRTFTRTQKKGPVTVVSESYGCGRGCRANAINMPKTDAWVLGRFDATRHEIITALPDDDGNGVEQRRQELLSLLELEDQALRRLRSGGPAARLAQSRIEDIAAELDTLEERTPNARRQVEGLLEGKALRECPEHVQRKVLQMTVAVTVMPASGRGGKFDADRIVVSRRAQ